MKKKYLILCVDDNQNNLYALNALLTTLNNIQCLESIDAKSALDILLVQDVDLILCDVQMPDINGFTLAKMIKGNKKTKHIPIIFVTAVGVEAKHFKQGYESGAVDYLLKPVTPYILRSKVQIFLDLEYQTKKIREQESILERKNLELRAVLDELKALKGLISICSWCKSIRRDDGYWEKVEEYVERVSAAEFTHGVCPSCAKKIKEDIKKDHFCS